MSKQKLDIPLSDQCKALARELYAKMHWTGKGGQHWDKYDDEREIDKIAEQITVIVKDAYVKGGDDVHNALKR